MDPAKTVIVIRSLVPDGVAELDGRLLPGDRLMFVNATDLENASLEDAVQALKGAGMGKVHIGVSKPLPVRNVKIIVFLLYWCSGWSWYCVCVCVKMWRNVCVCVCMLSADQCPSNWIPLQAV